MPVGGAVAVGGAVGGAWAGPPPSNSNFAFETFIEIYKNYVQFRQSDVLSLGQYLLGVRGYLGGYLAGYLGTACLWEGGGGLWFQQPNRCPLPPGRVLMCCGGL